MANILSLLRVFVERFPFFATSYRELREIWRYYSSRPKATPQGFLLSGNASMEAGTFEPFETNIVEALLPYVDVVVNIGANIGYYVCIARLHEKHVVAFEPIPSNVRLLLRNLRINQWEDVEVYPVALGERPGLAELYGGGTGASLLKGWAGTSELFVTLVPINTLDNILGERFSGQRLLFIIDVEGAELAVINGAKHHLSMMPKPIWMVEVAVTEHLPAGHTVNPDLLKTFQAFWRAGYVALKLKQGLGEVREEEVVSIQRGGKNTLKVNNFLFVEANRCSEIRHSCLNR